MIIRRKSVYTGVVRSKEIPVNPKDYEMWEKGYVSMSEAMGYLEQEDREFILSGMTPNEWNQAFTTEIQKIVSDTI